MDDSARIIAGGIVQSLMSTIPIHRKVKHPMWILQGQRAGRQREIICERLTIEGAIAEREKRLKTQFKVLITKNGPKVTRIYTPWEWTAITEHRNAQR